MTLYRTEWSIGSDLTPEWAFRTVGDGAEPWRLSWLRERPLSREQAIAGMELDELLSDPERVHDRAHLARIDDCADRLGLSRDHAIILLARASPPAYRTDRRGRRTGRARLPLPALRTAHHRTALRHS